MLPILNNTTAILRLISNIFQIIKRKFLAGKYLLVFQTSISTQLHNLQPQLQAHRPIMTTYLTFLELGKTRGWFWPENRDFLASIVGDDTASKVPVVPKPHNWRVISKPNIDTPTSSARYLNNISFLIYFIIN